jgi:hypothetical protein
MISHICCYAVQGDNVRTAAVAVTVTVAALALAPCVTQKQIAVVKLPKEIRSGLLQLLLL